MFRRPNLRYGTTPPAETPYQRAQQVWDERIGSARVQAYNWRTMAFACIGVIVLQLGVIVWQNARGTIVPWVVEVDELGEAQAVAPANADYRPTDPQIAFHLARFVEHVRTISADPIITRQNWLRAYDFTNTSGAQALNELARENDPFADPNVRVAIEVSSVIRASPDSFRIAWTEARYRDGSLAERARWTAILTTTIQPPRTPEALRKNPLGVFVTAIHWSRELEQ